MFADRQFDNYIHSSRDIFYCCRWFEIFAYRLGGNESRKVALLFTDITERKKAEESLLIKNEQLERTNADLDNFIYTASHDLRAPIINIESLVNVMHKSFSEERKNDVKTRALMGMINKSIESFKGTIKDLTEVAKVKSTGEEDLDEISFAELMEDVKLNIKTLIDESNVQIRIFSAKPKDDQILLAVQDNGLGIKEQDKPKLFKMFTRLHLHV